MMNGRNPILPFYEHIPDGEPRLFGDRVYLYGSHDDRHGEKFCSEDYVCWSASAENLNEWRYDGVIYKKEQDPYNADGKRCMFAPDVVQGIDGRYYLYYGLDTLGQISVAVCDTPNGRYEFYGMVEVQKENGSRELLKNPFPFDPGVLVENGKVYLYYGFCPGIIDKKVPMLTNDRASVVCELEEDMLTVKSEPKYLIPSWKTSDGTGFEGHEFFEASSIRKINGKYYFIYSSILSHELCYAVSDYPDRDFVYGGTIISNGDIGLNGRKEEHRVNYTGNIHGSILQIHEYLYVFYHRHTEAIRCCRQACAEQITMLPDGRILQAEVTSQGISGKPLSTSEKYSSAYCCNLISENGADHIEGEVHRRDEIPYIYENGDGYIKNISSGTNIGFKYVEFTGKEERVELLIRGDVKGSVRVLIDGGTKIWLTGRKGRSIGQAEINIDTEKWMEIEVPIEKVKGIYSFYVIYEGNGKMEWKSLGFGLK